MAFWMNQWTPYPLEEFELASWIVFRSVETFCRAYNEMYLITSPPKKHIYSMTGQASMVAVEYWQGERWDWPPDDSSFQPTIGFRFDFHFFNWDYAQILTSFDLRYRRLKHLFIFGGKFNLIQIESPERNDGHTWLLENLRRPKIGRRVLAPMTMQYSLQS